MPIHSKVMTGGLVGGGGVALGPLVAYIVEWLGMPPMGDVVASAAGGALVWIMNNVAAYAKRETVHIPFADEPGDGMQGPTR